MLVEGILDKQELFERLDNDIELLNDLIDLFLEDYPQWMEKIETAVSESDAEALEKAAHTLKGAVSNFCVDEAVQAAEKLQLGGKQNNLASAASDFNDLKMAMDKVDRALQSLASEHAS